MCRGMRRIPSATGMKVGSTVVLFAARREFGAGRDCEAG